MADLFAACCVERVDAVLTPFIRLLAEAVFQPMLGTWAESSYRDRHLLSLNNMKENTMSFLSLATSLSSFAAIASFLQSRRKLTSRSFTAEHGSNNRQFTRQP